MTYLAVSALSHIGAVRDHHEDSLVVGPWTLCATVTETPQTLVFPLGTPLIVAVADGLGGHAGGEVASALVARQLAQLGPLLDSEDRLREALDACNRDVYAAAARDPALTGMGTTVAGVAVTADHVLAFNVGDSRVYAVGPEGVRQLSTDDRLGDDGLRTGIVTQALGGSDEPAAIDSHLITLPLSAETSYLICTDGLTDPLPAGLLEEVLGQHEDGRAVFELWKAAVEAGGPDNITIAFVRATIDSARQLAGADDVDGDDLPAPDGVGPGVVLRRPGAVVDDRQVEADPVTGSAQLSGPLGAGAGVPGDKLRIALAGA